MSGADRTQIQETIPRVISPLTMNVYRCCYLIDSWDSSWHQLSGRGITTSWVIYWCLIKSIYRTMPVLNVETLLNVKTIIECQDIPNWCYCFYQWCHTDRYFFSIRVRYWQYHTEIKWEMSKLPIIFFY
jgi:hypothetical protein